MVVLLSYTAELQHNCSLTPPPQTKKKDGKNRMENQMEKAQDLRQVQADHSLTIIMGKTDSA